MMTVPERILEEDVDAELLRRNRLGESQAVLAAAFGVSKSLVQRRIARARLALTDESDAVRAAGDIQAGSSSAAAAETPIMIRAEYERIVREAKDARSRVAALRELDRFDREGDPPGDLRHQLLATKRRIRELEIQQFRLPRFMPGVKEWFASLPPDIEDWTQLLDAPVELIDQCGDAHHVLAEDVWLYTEKLGWTTPPVWEPDDDVIEEWRARIAEFDARKTDAERKPADRVDMQASSS
jgi:hypothetical protein